MSDTDAPSLHRQVAKQLRRLGLTPDASPSAEQWARFLGRVSAAYSDADDDRYLMERSLEISGTEMADLYEELRRTSESRLAAEHGRLVAVTDHSPIAIAEFDVHGNVLFANPASRAMAGDVNRLGGDGTVFFLVHEADRSMVADAALASWSERADKTIIVRTVPPDGRIRYLRARIRAQRAAGDDDLMTASWFMAASDVTEELEARASSDRLTALLEAATDLVAVFDPTGELLHLNRVGCRYLGISDETELIGRAVFELFDPASRDRIRKEALPAVRTDGTWSGEATLVGPDLATPMSLVVIGHRNEDGALEYCSAIARDVTELKEVQHALAREATHDALTGLPNRALLLDRLNQAVLRTQRSGADLAVIYIDLDRVKIVNDSLGHEAGDRLLIEAARRLEAGRSLDTVGRLGGDEFVIVAQDLDGPRGGVRLAMRVVHAFNEPFDLEGTEAFVTASVGVAFRVQQEDSAVTLLRDADVAMYRAKEAGGGRYELFDAEMRVWATDRFETESALRHAIERDELHVHYQPQVRPESGEVVGFEALARWNRATIGPVSPAVFIPLAEETGLISVIGAHVLEHACREARQWTDRLSEPLRLAVNVSGRQATQPGLLEVVERVLDVTSFDPKCLTLEITESVLVHDPAVARTRLEALRELGVRIAIDDFGKGYSSLAYLQRFPLDVVKIDQVFVADLGRSGRDTTIVASMIALAHALGFEVVAEGVEDAMQISTLIELGCDLIQGHVIAPVLPAAAAVEFLEATSASKETAPAGVSPRARCEVE